MGTKSRDVPLSTGTLATGTLLAALLPAWAALRGLSLSIYFKPTDTALHAARTGHGLLAAGAIAALVLLALAVGLRWIAPASQTVLSAGVAVAVVGVLGLTGLVWVHADRALHNYGPEVRALDAFVAPAGAVRSGDVRRASEHPEAQRSWRVPAPAEDLCRRAVERFEAWADPGSVTKTFPNMPSSCSHKGRRGADRVELLVSDPAHGPQGQGLVIVTARRG